MSQYNIMVTGVGGQGVLFTSEVLGEAALREGLDTRVAEVHGMAQRGGSVTCSVRIGKNVYSPTIMEGTADMIIGLEPLEVLRLLEFVHDQTLVIVNKTQVVPSSTSYSGIEYPSIDAILDEIRKVSKNVLSISAKDIALEAGNPAAQNVVMIGFISASGKLPIASETLREVISGRSPSRHKEFNLKAFELGEEEYKKKV